jgi:all-trans-retinol 13,14-reductase
MYGIRKDSDNYLKTMILPHTKIPGFYFTGQNLNMHGAPGVTIGSIMTCAEILGMEYLFKKLHDAV